MYETHKIFSKKKKKSGAFTHKYHWVKILKTWVFNEIIQFIIMYLKESILYMSVCWIISQRTQAGSHSKFRKKKLNPLKPNTLYC